ncbi:hypothetical protein M9458_012915, partial [Cirrhinus mrigala]
PLSVEVPVSMSGQPSLTKWSAILERGVSNPTGPRALSVSLSSPASASVGVYTLQLRNISVRPVHAPLQPLVP